MATGLDTEVVQADLLAGLALDEDRLQRGLSDGEAGSTDLAKGVPEEGVDLVLGLLDPGTSAGGVGLVRLVGQVVSIFELAANVAGTDIGRFRNVGHREFVGPSGRREITPVHQRDGLAIAVDSQIDVGLAARVGLVRHDSGSGPWHGGSECRGCCGDGCRDGKRCQEQGRGEGEAASHKDSWFGYGAGLFIALTGARRGVRPAVMRGCTLCGIHVRTEPGENFATQRFRLVTISIEP